MDNVIKYITGFLTGMNTILLAAPPLTILWFVITGGTIFGMDVIANLTTLITSLGQGGFVGLVVLLMVMSFFVDKK